MYSTTKHHQQLGSSLIESLVALAITSAFALVVIKLQVGLLRHTKHAHQQELAIQSHISLAESLKSCLGNTTCQRAEIVRWSKRQLIGKSELEPQPGTMNTVCSKIYWHDNKVSTLKFSYA